MKKCIKVERDLTRQHDFCPRVILHQMSSLKYKNLGEYSEIQGALLNNQHFLSAQHNNFNSMGIITTTLINIYPQSTTLTQII